MKPTSYCRSFDIEYCNGNTGVYGSKLTVFQKALLLGKVDQNSGHRLAVENAFVIETDDLPLRFDEPNSPFPDDKVHFNTYGILELGKRFAEKYIKEG